MRSKRVGRVFGAMKMTFLFERVPFGAVMLLLFFIQLVHPNENVAKLCGKLTVQY